MHVKCQAGWNTSLNQDCWENINNLRYTNDTTLMAKSEEELKSLLMKVKEESEKVCIKLNIQKTKIMASSPITSWQIGGKTMATWQVLFSWAPKSVQMVAAAMTLKEVCSLKKRYDKSRQYIKRQSYFFNFVTLSTKVCLVKAMVFPVVMYGCERWTIKKAECRRTDAFELR